MSPHSTPVFRSIQSESELPYRPPGVRLAGDAADCTSFALQIKLMGSLLSYKLCSEQRTSRLKRRL